MATTSTPQVVTGPWRATKLWNEIVAAFQHGIPLKKHRKGIKIYENCFTGIEAGDWLHKYLQKNPNFGSDVKREQTLRLLNKLFKAAVIKRIYISSSSTNLDESFKDNSDLYTFPNDIERLITQDEIRNPLLELRQKNKSPLQNTENKRILNKNYIQSLPTNTLILLDNNAVWKKAFENQLRKSFGDKPLPSINIDTLTFNMTNVSAKGIVQIRDKKLDLPHWVLSAMKCLANWPKPKDGSQEDLPNYIGFEKDVFSVVREYFLQQIQAPLIPSFLTEIFESFYRKASENPMELPPNTCFETAFMFESPVTRIVPQKNSETLHFSSKFTSLDRSTESLDVKQSRWRRSSRARKSIAVMSRTTEESERVFYSEDETLDRFINDDCIIPSKTVRKQKHRSLMKRSSNEPRIPFGGYINPGCMELYTTSTYQNLTVKTPVLRKFSLGEASKLEIASKSLIHSFRLLTLLIVPHARRKLQLLLKFIKRVCINSKLKLSSNQSNLAFLLDVFSNTILHSSKNQDIIRFFLEHYEEIWTAPDCLRREVEENVYASLVNKRIQAGEDPYPITFCQRISADKYERAKISGSQTALLDLLQHILTHSKMNLKEKKRKVLKFKEAYPQIYSIQFPTFSSEPDYMKDSSPERNPKISSLTRIKNAMRI